MTYCTYISRYNIILCLLNSILAIVIHWTDLSWWMLFQKRAVRTTFYIYVSINVKTKHKVILFGNINLTENEIFVKTVFHGFNIHLLLIIPPSNKVWGGGGVYRNHPVRPSVCLSVHVLDSNHIPSCTSAGSVLQLCKVS
jgi:hypothetical protein